MKRVAIVGTNGVPAKYGGFETLADNLVRGLRGRYAFTVYCSRTASRNKLSGYYGARLVHLPLRANGWQSVIYDLISTIHALFTSQVILVLGPSFGFVFVLNFLFRRNIVVNFGGLNEWEREKFPWLLRKYVWVSFYVAARNSTSNIADNSVLKESLRQSFGVDSVVIRYGGDHAVAPADSYGDMEKKYPFTQRKYFLSVARAQVDNNLHLLIDAFRELPDHHLVIISNWEVSSYGRNLFRDSQGIKNVTLLDAIYDLDELNFVRSKAWVYVHTHSRCGTAPSLVEAICMGLAILSLDVATNREATAGKALYFSTAAELQGIVGRLTVDDVTALRTALSDLAVNEYRWRHVCEQYALVFDLY